MFALIFRSQFVRKAFLSSSKQATFPLFERTCLQTRFLSTEGSPEGGQTRKEESLEEDPSLFLKRKATNSHEKGGFLRSKPTLASNGNQRFRKNQKSGEQHLLGRDFDENDSPFEGNDRFQGRRQGGKRGNRFDRRGGEGGRGEGGRGRGEEKGGARHSGGDEEQGEHSVSSGYLEDEDFYNLEKEYTLDDVRALRRGSEGGADTDIWDVVQERSSGDWTLDMDPTATTETDSYLGFITSIFNEFGKSSDGSFWIGSFEKPGDKLAAPQPRTLQELIRDQMMPATKISSSHWFYPELEKMWLHLCRRFDLSYSQRVRYLKVAASLISRFPHPLDTMDDRYKKDWRLLAGHLVSSHEAGVEFMERKDALMNALDSGVSYDQLYEQESEVEVSKKEQEHEEELLFEKEKMALTEADWEEAERTGFFKQHGYDTEDDEATFDEDEFEAMEKLLLQAKREKLEREEAERRRQLQASKASEQNNFPSWNEPWYEDVFSEATVEAVRKEHEEEEERLRKARQEALKKKKK